MKRIIPFIAVAVAMAVPITISAQTPDYYGYENQDKGELMQLVVDAINDGDITFTTTQAKEDFLDLYGDLCSYAAQSNWSSCATTAGDMADVAQYIVEDSKDLVEDLCEATQGAFIATGLEMCITPSDYEDLQEDLTQGGSGTWYPGDSLHLGGCVWVVYADSSRMHTGDCTTFYWPHD